MPIIPLPKTTQIDAAPAPAMDRLRRPTIDTSEQRAAVGMLAKSGQMPEMPDTLAAPMRALGAVGEALADVGNVAGALALKRQQAQADIQVAEADAEFMQEDADFSSWQAQNLDDPTKWAAERQKRMDALRGRLFAREDLTPEARDRINILVTRRSAVGLNETQRQADQALFGRAKAAVMDNVELAIETQDKARLESALGEGVKKGYLFDFEAERAQLKFGEVGERKQKEAKAAAFNAAQNGAVTLATANGEEAALAELDKGTLGKLEPTDMERLRSTIKQVAGQRQAEALDAVVGDIFTGKLNSPAAIDAVDNPHFTAKARELAKRELSQFNAADASEDRRVNGVANSVDLLQRAKDYDKATDKDGTKFFELMAETKRRVPDGMDGAITGLLYQKFAGQTKPLKPREEVMANLKQRLADAYDPKTGLIPWRKTETKQVEVTDRITGKKMKEWKEVEVEDAAAKQRAMDAQTRVLMKLEDWGKTHPEDFNDLDKVRAKFIELLPEGTRAGLLDKMKPKAATVGKVTSYGYQGDATPDGASLAGIGAWVPPEEQAKIRRGEPSEYRLRDGDLAVSPDVEQSFARAGVKPGDKVLLKLANGERRIARWMDRTAQDEDVRSGRIKGVTKPLRGRFDFYSANGPHPLDGVPVVGWEKAV